MANFTVDGKQGRYDVFCSQESLPQGIHNQLTSLTTFTIFLSVTAILGNSLILVALRKESSIHSPSKLLLGNLAATDLFVGLISEPLYAVYLLSVVNEHWNA